MLKRKKPSLEGSKQDGNRWTLTYLDMITLLFALFTMLYSMSSINEKKYEAVAKSFHVALNNTTAVSGTGFGPGTGFGYGAASEESGVVNLQTLLSSGENASSSSGGGHGAPVNDALTEIYNVLSEYIKQNNLQNEIGLEDMGTYVQIHLKDVVLFKGNSAEVLPTSEPILKEIEQALGKVYTRVDHITISGHTADIVLDPKNSDALSWKLSTDRAVTVLNELIRYGLPQNKLSIQGYAHFDPVAPNNTEEGRSKNRRVEITVFKNPAEGVGATGRASSEPAETASSAAIAPAQPNTASAQAASH